MKHCNRGILLALIATVILVSFLNIAVAIQLDKTIEYNGGGMGKVIFDGTQHNEAGLHCMKCHNTYFMPKIGAVKILYSHHTARKEYCFACHNGTEAFDAVGNCKLCHKK